MKSLHDILILSTTYLKEKGITQPRRQAEVLLCDAFGLTRLQLYMDLERPLSKKEIVLCRDRLKRRAQGEPSQYIHGEVEFYNCSFLVNSSVLIPRQETEILVDKIASKLARHDLKGKVLWDICCGSGCIGISLKKRFPELQIVLSDVSSAALRVSKENAKRNEVEVECIQGDLLTPFKGKKTDFLVCNPPYVSEMDFGKLETEVRGYEPKLALVGGKRGTEFYERLAKELSSYLQPRAAVWFEIGYDQGMTVQELFKGGPWKRWQFENDWSGQNRFFFLENE